MQALVALRAAKPPATRLGRVPQPREAHECRQPVDVGPVGTQAVTRHPRAFSQLVRNRRGAQWRQIQIGRGRRYFRDAAKAGTTGILGAPRAASQPWRVVVGVLLLSEVEHCKRTVKWGNLIGASTAYSEASVPIYGSAHLPRRR